MVATASKENRNRDLLYLLGDSGKMKMVLGNGISAKDDFQHQRRICGVLGCSDSAKSEIELNIGTACMMCEQYSEAEKYFNDCLKLSNDREFKVKILRHLFLSMTTKGNRVFVINRIEGCKLSASLKKFMKFR